MLHDRGYEEVRCPADRLIVAEPPVLWQLDFGRPPVLLQDIDTGHFTNAAVKFVSSGQPLIDRGGIHPGVPSLSGLRISDLLRRWITAM